MAITPDADPQNVHVTEANGNSVSPFVRPVANLVGGFQLILGLFGFWGVYLYLVEPKGNHSRYQLLFLPIWTFILAVPLIIAAAFLYRRCKSDMSLIEQLLLNIGCTLPVLALALAMAVSYL